MISEAVNSILNKLPESLT